MAVAHDDLRESRRMAVEATMLHGLRQEAVASSALDGDTWAMTCSVRQRTTPGFGCPNCGASLVDVPRRDLVTTLRCCGHALDGRSAARLLVAVHHDPTRELVETAA